MIQSGKEHVMGALVLFLCHMVIDDALIECINNYGKVLFHLRNTSYIYKEIFVASPIVGSLLLANKAHSYGCTMIKLLPW